VSDTERSIGPCAYPGCRDDDGNARLTRDTICDPSRRHYRKILDRLALHYVLLRLTLPKPTPPPGERVMRIVSRVYGHPAEWASDTAAQVATELNGAHDMLAEHLRHDPPPHPGSREYGRVAHAHHYLTSWFDRLCTMPGAADTAEALYDLDRDIRRGLGKTDPRSFLPVPCPACDLLGLVRTISLDDGEDSVECRACGEKIPSERYGWWTRRLLDELVGDPA
jgi:hypothetical protein